MPIPRKSLNSYNTKALQWADRMRNGNNTAHDYLEKPAMYKLLPDLKGRSVLCLGCGTGEECNTFMTRGAATVTGIDISAGMLKEARKAYPRIEFHKMDMSRLLFPDNSFDFAYSSLALHYQKDWLPCLKEIYRVLKPGGVFLFSTHHPFRWGMEMKITPGTRSHYIGFSNNKKGDLEIWGNYFKSRKIDDIWFGDFEVSYYHQPLNAILKYIIDSGFKLESFEEPIPLLSTKKVEPTFWEINSRIPLFMIFLLKK